MDITSLIFYFLVIVPSAIFHEYAHGWMAERLGDSTARYAGRLTLDPRPHIDLFGTILMPLLLFFATGGNFLFAYAKPVPYNPYNLRDQRFGPLYVALAGPLSNFLLAAAFGVLLRFFGAEAAFAPFLSIIVYANVMLGVFNLVPIPPLDGSKVLYAFLPASAHRFYSALERYGFFALIIFVFYFSSFISPAVRFVYQLLTGERGLF